MKPHYDREAIRAEAEAYIDEHGCPRTNRLLAEKTGERCQTKGILVPKEYWLQYLTSPIFKRHRLQRQERPEQESPWLRVAMFSQGSRTNPTSNGFMGWPPK